MTQSEDTAAELFAFYGGGQKYPTLEQWRSLLNSNHTGPVVMVNMIRLEETAANPYDSKEQLSGLELMMRYQSASIEAVERFGGSSVYSGLVGQAVIGRSEWDIVGLVEYPDIGAFISVFRDANYRAAHLNRSAACADHQLLLSFPA